MLHDLALLAFTPATVGIAGLVVVPLMARRQVRDERRYTGRHRDSRRLSYLDEWRLHRAVETDRRKRVEYESLMEWRRMREFPELADASNDAEEFDTPAQTKGAYAHLRTAELDSTAERFFALVEKGIRPPSPWGTPMVDDDWSVPAAGVELVAVGGRGAADHG